MKPSFSIFRFAYLFTFAFGLAHLSVALPLQFASGINSASTPTAGGGGDSWHPIITPDGRYVLFASRANNLVLSGTNNSFLNQMPPKINVFLRDRANGTTTLVSVNFSGTGPGNGDSMLRARIRHRSPRMAVMWYFAARRQGSFTRAHPSSTKSTSAIWLRRPRR